MKIAIDKLLEKYTSKNKKVTKPFLIKYTPHFAVAIIILTICFFCYLQKPDFILVLPTALFGLTIILFSFFSSKRTKWENKIKKKRSKCVKKFIKNKYENAIDDFINEYQKLLSIKNQFYTIFGLFITAVVFISSILLTVWQPLFMNSSNYLFFAIFFTLSLILISVITFIISDVVYGFVNYKVFILKGLITELIDYKIKMRASKRQK